MLPPVTSWASQSNLNICRQPAHQLLKLNRPRAHNFQGPTQNCPLRELTRMTVAQRSFHLIFCDKNEPSLQALCRAFHGIQDVSFLTQDIRTLHRLRRPSAICSVGNSFGIMDGGVDWVVREMLSPPPARTSVQAKCQEAISEQFMGEQPLEVPCGVPANHPSRELIRMAAVQRNFHMTFCDRNEAGMQALRKAFDGITDVSFISQDIGTLQGLRRPSAMCSAGNSFGIMDGGVDWAVREMLSSPGVSMQAKCQEAIAEQFMGEQPVGTCILVPAPVKNVFDWLAYAPTMVVPEDCRGTRNPYLAFRSLLTTLLRHNASTSEPIRSVIATSMCTGSGGVSHHDAANQMRLAYANVFEAPTRIVWPSVLQFQRDLKQFREGG
ncbi:hypothetical protein WJX74_009522 [Apatococcus lobatus]|uniref:Macro domain-containing protein n=1 Tax=Apatococcus lobatus TaxID=904363 RepID=A0AAW1RX95_9CHLO